MDNKQTCTLLIYLEMKAMRNIASRIIAMPIKQNCPMNRKAKTAVSMMPTKAAQTLHKFCTKSFNRGACTVAIAQISALTSEYDCVLETTSNFIYKKLRSAALIRIQHFSE